MTTKLSPPSTSALPAPAGTRMGTVPLMDLVDRAQRLPITSGQCTVYADLFLLLESLRGTSQPPRK